MATSLYLTTNSKLRGKVAQEEWDRIVRELNQLQLDTTSYVYEKNEIIKENESWSYNIEEEEEYILFNVDFGGPFHIQPRLCSNIGVIYTIYKYRLLYAIYGFDWFISFRYDLYNIVKIIGGTEVIYLADNACNKLSIYLECMAWENVPYEEIKEKIFQDFGQQVTEYTKLNYDTLTYQKIDDFSDLKMKEKTNQYTLKNNRYSVNLCVFMSW